jgi:hypothetical protein
LIFFIGGFWMRTTIYINHYHFNKLIDASNLLNISRNELISMFISRLTHDNRFETKLFETVKYQDSESNINWITMHVKFEPVFYEKALDLRRHYKYSVSWFISYAIMEYLDDIVGKLLNPENRKKIWDNYDRNYIYISREYENIHTFTVSWGFVKEKYLKKLLQ